MPRRHQLSEVLIVFARLGATAFGGPAAHVALMRHELIERRRWEDERTFVDLVGLTSLLPGPNSTELAIEMGRRRAGTAGLVAAGLAFVTPATAIVGTLAWTYVTYASVDFLDDVRFGVLPVVLAVVAHAAWKLGRAAITTPTGVAIAAAAAVALLLDVHEVLILVAGALLGGVAGRVPRAVASHVVPPVALLVARARGDIGTAELFARFLRIGALLFGSGYVLVTFLEREFVERAGVLTAAEVLDAVSVGQVTPGPVFTTATFIGYVLGGPWGAVAATIGIFLPAFVLVALFGRFLAPLLSSTAARPFLDGLNAAAVGLIVAVVIDLAPVVLDHPLRIVIAAACAAGLVLTGVNPSWLMIAGAAVGTATYLLG